MGKHNLTNFTVLIDCELRDEIKLNAVTKKMSIRDYLSEVIKIGMKVHENNK